MRISYEIAPSKGTARWKLYLTHDGIANTYELAFHNVSGGTSYPAKLINGFARGRQRLYVVCEHQEVPASIAGAYRLCLDSVAYSTIGLPKTLTERELSEEKARQLFRVIVIHKKKSTTAEV